MRATSRLAEESDRSREAPPCTSHRPAEEEGESPKSEQTSRRKATSHVQTPRAETRTPGIRRTRKNLHVTNRGEPHAGRPAHDNHTHRIRSFGSELCKPGCEFGVCGCSLFRGVVESVRSAEFFVLSDRTRVRTRRDAAYIQKVGSVVQHLQTVRNRPTRIETQTTIRKRVGRYIDDAHDTWPIQRHIGKRGSRSPEITHNLTKLRARSSSPRHLRSRKARCLHAASDVPPNLHEGVCVQHPVLQRSQIGVGKLPPAPAISRQKKRANRQNRSRHHHGKQLRMCKRPEPKHERREYAGLEKTCTSQTEGNLMQDDPHTTTIHTASAVSKANFANPDSNSACVVAACFEAWWNPSGLRRPCEKVFPPIWKSLLPFPPALRAQSSRRAEESLRPLR